MSASISAARVATLVGEFDRSPAYAGLADALVLLVGDGRIGLDVRLPSERELTDALGVSRTTVTRAYAVLRDSGYAEARQGAGTFTRVPGGRQRVHDKALMPWPDTDRDTVDLTCASATAPPGLAAAYVDAVAALPAHLGGHGYFPTGLPELQAAIARRYDERGLPTDPGQVIVTAGALAATAIAVRALAGPGDRAVVDTPVYPNASESVRLTGARLVGAEVDPDRWDVSALTAAVRQAAPTVAYLIPDFQNPTGHLMSDEQREECAAALRRARTVAIVDESLQALALDGQQMPRPFASYSTDAVTIGSASKAFWGGLRLGWIRAPHALMDRLTRARLALDLGAPVLEQLVLARLLEQAPALPEHIVRLREQRDALMAAVSDELPDWRFRRPGGGLSLWCELPTPRATALAVEAETRGVPLAPGPVFSLDGGLDRYVRIPWGRPPAELQDAVRRLAAAWAVVQERPHPPGRTAGRVLVA
ncbi:PLP-dependent aminotransferase family protein [Nocardioides lianchengensis]|uniref:DNA-binding transcriptional regulator, MocR family, contains an aminotransferase domain n=1 Tax=Nocardioides lianchengensis TaxID=1045774 RepID=A0A1G6NN73_9ACTN|nr:PLP-dependent aminotransferase family protein [Nocardioides lianchengensis]NYG10826.1 DNA-binding transcriptional MocR family regulator [Nocardioides lianchengensis]SDC69101.1 DNA-binding transcriptional regulator, MocR family, contains an aminotransferase domain [Nocardioides lianchengensis]